MAKAKESVPTLTTIGAFRLTAGGLKVEGKPSFGQWEAAVIEAKALGVCLMWVIGDLLIYGEDTYGEEYAQALEAADYADETIRQAQRIARQFPPEVRLASLPFSFHRTVAPLPQKQGLALLRKAGEQGWTRSVLALEVAKLKEPEADGTRVPETTDAPDADDAEPVEIDGDPAKCLDTVAGMQKARAKWVALFSSLMAAYPDVVVNTAGGFSGCTPEKTGEVVKVGTLGPINFGPVEYTCANMIELGNFEGNLRAAFTRLGRIEVPGKGVAPWEMEES